MQNKLYLIRHGECASALLQGNDRMLNEEENTLTKNGQQQVHNLGNYLYHNINNQVSCYSSPIARAAETAHILAQKLHLSIQFDDLLAERRGNFNTQTSCLEHKEIQEQLIATPKKSIQGWESIWSHRMRIEKWWASLSFTKAKTVLVVAHGGTIEHLLAIIQHSPYQNCTQYFTKLDYGCYHELSFFQNKRINPNGIIFRLNRVNVRST